MLLSIWHSCLLLLIWPPWPLSVNSVGVDPPSASNAMSMASSLLQTLTENEFGDPLDGGEDNRRRNRPEMCKVKNLKQQQKMSMAKLDAHRCLIRDVWAKYPFLIRSLRLMFTPVMSLFPDAQVSQRKNNFSLTHFHQFLYSIEFSFCVSFIHMKAEKIRVENMGQAVM